MAMYSYRLDRLDADSFEHMIQSLVQGLAGIKCEIFGDGPDGQREAVIDDANFTVNQDTQALGRTIVQAKYKAPHTKEKDWVWLKKNLEEELIRFKLKKEKEPGYLPETYLFFTNVVLTPVKDTGVKDKAGKLAGSYQDVIPHIIILGNDEIMALLDNNRNVAASYASYIMPGDILVKMYERLQLEDSRPLEALCQYARQTMEDDLPVNLEQAGKLTDNVVNLHDVFIDLEACGQGGAEVDSGSERIAGYIIRQGNRICRFRGDAHDLPDKAPESNKFVLIGNAGQGKSTICQYICQIYRAHFLKLHNQAGAAQSLYLKKDDILQPKCMRYPVRVILRDYAGWINASKPEEDRGIQTYIRTLVGLKTGSALNFSDFHKLLRCYSWLFVFDGLDEVPVSSNRTEVLRQIFNFVEFELPDCGCDFIVLCTTRPQGYTDEFSPEKYQHFQIQDMSQAICMEYLQRLMEKLETNVERRKEYLGILQAALQDEMVSRLMTTPLQTSIVAILVKAGGKPPSDRFALFREYYDTAVRREKQKKVIPALNDNMDWINELHYQTGFRLQCESEQADNASALLTTDSLREMIHNYIVEQVGEELSVAETDNRTDLLYEMITMRLTFISELRQDRVGFPLRSMQEFFAANYLVVQKSDIQVISNIESIAAKAYWRNVLLFAAGSFMNSRNYLEPHLYKICQEQNGAGDDGGEYSVTSIPKMGSWLALDLLADNLFVNAKVQNRYLKLAGEILELVGIDSIHLSIFARLPKYLTDKFIREYLERWLLLPGPKSDTAWDILEVILLGNNREEGNKSVEEFLVKNVADMELNDNRVNILLRYTTRYPSSEELKKVIIDYLEGIYCFEIEDSTTVSNYISLMNHAENNKRLSQVLVRSLLYYGGMVYTSFTDLDEEYKSIMDWMFRRRRSGHVFPGRMEYRLDTVQPEHANLQISDALMKLMQEKEINEFYALFCFLQRPSAESMKQLGRAYRELLPEQRRLFLNQIRVNWVLKDLAEKLLSQPDDPDVFDYYDENKFRILSEQEESILYCLHTSIKTDDFSDITRQKSWDNITIGFNMEEAVEEKTDLELKYLLSASKFSILKLKEYDSSYINIICFTAAMTIELWTTIGKLPKEILRLCLIRGEDVCRSIWGAIVLTGTIAASPLTELEKLTCHKFSVNMVREDLPVEVCRAAVRKICYLYEERLNEGLLELLPHIVSMVRDHRAAFSGDCQTCIQRLGDQQRNLSEAMSMIALRLAGPVESREERELILNILSRCLKDPEEQKRTLAYFVTVTGYPVLAQNVSWLLPPLYAMLYSLEMEEEGSRQKRDEVIRQCREALFQYSSSEIAVFK